MAEWLRRWTWNPLGSPRAGSNPADYVGDLLKSSRDSDWFWNNFKHIWTNMTMIAQGMDTASLKTRKFESCRLRCIFYCTILYCNKDDGGRTRYFFLARTLKEKDLWLSERSELTDKVGSESRSYKIKKILSRARFWSSDLWVMGPARFHCATLLLRGNGGHKSPI